MTDESINRKERKKLYMKEYYAKNKAKIMKKVIEWRKRPENQAKVLAWRKRCWKGYYGENAERLLANQRKYRAANKSEMSWGGSIKTIIEKMALIEGYGGKCACCEEDRFEFLTLDHIHGGGNKQRKEKKSAYGQRVAYGYFLYRHLRQLGYPKDHYRLLCMSCNFSYGKYGYCPHQFEQSREYGLSACG